MLTGIQNVADFCFIGISSAVGVAVGGIATVLGFGEID